MSRKFICNSIVGTMVLLWSAMGGLAAQGRVVTESGVTIVKKKTRNADLFKEFRVSAPTDVVQGQEFWVTYTMVSKAWADFEWDEFAPFTLHETQITYGEEGDYHTANISMRLSMVRSGCFTLPGFSVTIAGEKKHPNPATILITPHPDYGEELSKGYDWIESHTFKPCTLKVSYYDDYACLFSDDKNDCFVLVAKSKYWSALGNNPVLAYSDESAFPQNNVVEKDNTLTPLLGQYWKQLSHLLANHAQTFSVKSYQRKQESQPKLLGKTQWGQDKPFNTRTPIRDGQHTLIGCVPLSVAQVLYRYKYPSVGESYSYYTNEEGVVKRVVYDDWQPEWGNFKDTYSKDASRYEVDPLARFMTWLSYGLDAEHGTSGTSAHMQSVKPLLCNNLKYSGRVQLHRGISEDRLLGLIYRELDNQRPCLVEYEGHAFVCDGYDGDFLHYNFGWHGFGNGYYRTVLQQPSDSNSAYLFLRGVITGIEPQTQSVMRSIHLTQAGQLSEMLTLEEQTSITHLKVSGQLNNADIRLIRKMAGYDDESCSLAEPICGSLVSLDLSQASFVTDSLTAFYSRLADNTWTWTSSGGTVIKYKMDELTAAQWLSFCSQIGAYHHGYHYSMDADGRCRENYATAEGVISKYMFYGCTSLRHIDLPDGVTEILSSAFRNCCCLNNVSLSSQIKKVGDYAFYNCSSLDHISYYTNTQFGRDVFTNCSPAMRL